MLECKPGVSVRSLNTIGGWTSPVELLGRGHCDLLFVRREAGWKRCGGEGLMGSWIWPLPMVAERVIEPVPEEVWDNRDRDRRCFWEPRQIPGARDLQTV